MIQRPDTKQALLDAAIEVFSQEGPEASLRTVCDRVGVKLPTLYHFFGDKQGLLDAVLAASLDRYLARKRGLSASADPRIDLCRGWDLHVGFAKDNPAIYPLMFPLREGAAPQASQRSLELLRAGFERLAAEGLLKPGITPELATRSLSAALRGVATTISREPGHPGNAQLSTTVRDAVVDSLLTLESGST